MNEGTPQRQPEHKASPRTKAFGLFGVCLMSISLLPGCSTGGYDGSRESYIELNPTFAAQEMERAMQHPVVISSSTPFPTPNSKNEPPTLLNNMALCSEVKPGGSVSQAVQDANNGVFPPYIFGGLALQVSIDHNGIRTIKGLEEIMATGENPIVNSGDQVCISTNPARLQQQSTLTP